MIYYHELSYSVPQAFIEEDDILPILGLDEDYWQQVILFENQVNVSLWSDNGEVIPPTLQADEDFGQLRIFMNTTQQISLWM